MSSAGLPKHPHLDQLRRQAKEMKEAARGGDQAALTRLRPYLPADGSVTLAAAQLAVAREHGFASWARLKAEVELRTAEFAERVRMFLQRSLSGSAGAARLLRADPSIATYDIRTAAMLGEVATVRRYLAADPAVISRVDDELAWPPLLYVCMSRWHRLVFPDPEQAAEEAVRRMSERAEGMVAVARLLLDAGTDPNVTAFDGPRLCTPLYAAAGRADHAAMTALLLERGARPDDYTMYLAAFHAVPHRSAPGVIPGLRGPAGHDCLRLLLDRHRLPPTSVALAAPISLGDAVGVQMMLDAGADPNQPLSGDLLGEAYRGTPDQLPVSAAIRLGCDAALLELLLEYGGDANGIGPDGLSAQQIAVREGRPDLATLLVSHGARVQSTPVDRFLTACAQADRVEAERLLREHPGLLGTLTEQDRGLIVAAADRGATEAIRLMLDLGFPLDTRATPDGATALLAAARSGSADAVRILIDAGADIEAHDSQRNESPLSWAVIGSGRRLGHHPEPDRVATVRTLLDAGADPEQAWAAGVFPELEVARFLVERGLNVPGKDVAMMRHSLGLDRQ
ncbi:MAG TPA: ankyrin repeat domain-containing protein [Candidatus Limnocylindrales bacterium]|nr:ankyrin repeat domain-containing protein [Candidatus Limnocylindrales bacterium]